MRLPEGDTLMQDFRENPNEDFRQAYASTALENDLFDNGKMEVDLASPWQRIGARLLDIVIFAAIFMVFFFVIAIFIKDSMMVIGLSLLFVFAFGIYQMVIMSRDGQTIGKKALNIRVITENGNNPGFVKYCLVREFGYSFIFTLIGMVSKTLGDSLGIVATIVCVVMLFLEDRNRQTLQDLLAKTLVIKN